MMMIYAIFDKFVDKDVFDENLNVENLDLKLEEDVLNIRVD